MPPALSPETRACCTSPDCYHLNGGPFPFYRCSVCRRVFCAVHLYPIREEGRVLCMECHGIVKGVGRG